MPIHRRAVTSKDVAEAANVSRSTVSLVLNGKAAAARVSESTRIRVMHVAQQMGYVPNPSARALVNQQSNNIALMTTGSHISLKVPKFEDLAIGLIERSALRRYNVVIPSTVARAGKLGEDTLSSLQVDGIVLQTSHFDMELVRDVIASGIPFVAVESDTQEQPPNCVAHVHSNQDIGVRELGRFLLMRKYRRIGVISGPPGPTRESRYRFDVLENVFLEEGGEASIVTTVIANDWFAESGKSAFASIWSSDSSIDVIFAGNDMLAAGAMQAAKEAGLTVPEDVAIVGFGDFRMSSYLSPALTTISWPLAEMGAISADVLIGHLMHGETVDQPIALPTALIVRDSA